MAPHSLSHMQVHVRAHAHREPCRSTSDANIYMLTAAACHMLGGHTHPAATAPVACHMYVTCMSLSAGKVPDCSSLLNGSSTL